MSLLFKRRASNIEALQYTGNGQEILNFCPLVWGLGTPLQLFISIPSGSILSPTTSQPTATAPTQTLPNAPQKRIQFGDWIVKEGDHYTVYSSEEFTKNFEKTNG